MLSNVYLHYVLDLWFERVVKVQLKGEARLVRYIDDFVICFQHQSDALRVEDALRHRLGKFGLTLEPSKNQVGRVWSVCSERCEQTRQKSPGDDLLSGHDAVLLAEPKG